MLLLVLNFILTISYRKQLPQYPDNANVPKSIREQITSARLAVLIYTSSDNLGKLGMNFHSCADYEKAAKCYQLAIEKNSNKWKWSYYLGYLKLEQGELREAIDYFKHVTDKDSDNYLAWYYTAEAYEKLGHTDSAEKIFETVATSADVDFDELNRNRENFLPLKAYSLFQLARIYLNANRLDSAENTLKVIIDNVPTFGPAYRLLSNVYSRKDNSSEETRYAIRANDLADYAPPVDSLVDEIALISRSDQYLLKQIDNAIRSGNFRWARRLCDQSMKYFPDNKYLVSKAIFENFRQGNNDKALSMLDRHFNYYSNDAKELMDVTDLLFDKGLLKESKKYFDQVRKLMPQNSTLALWLYERGKKQEAVSIMDDLLRKNPENTTILSDEIKLLVNTGDSDLAKQYFTRLEKISPGSTATLKAGGLIADKEGDHKKALSLYERAYQIDSADLIFTKDLIDIYIREKDWQQAIKHFRSALNIYPNEPVLLEGLGRLLIACPDPAFKNIVEGIEYSERAFINFRSPYKTKLSAGKNLATAYVYTGNKKKAAKIINMTISLAKEANSDQEYITYFRNLVAKK